MRIYPKPIVNIIGILFIGMSLRLSYWQWDRHTEKKEYIKTLEERLAIAPVPIGEFLSLNQIDWTKLIHRRVILEGSYDYQHEMSLRNRRHNGLAGVFVLTPLRINKTNKVIVVNRGFAPLDFSSREGRRDLSRPQGASFVGLIKAPTIQKLFAPKDPPSGAGFPWVDAWLRMDLAAIQRQLPYPVLPVTLEIMSTATTAATTAEIVQGKSGRDEIFVPSERMYSMVSVPKILKPTEYPVAVFDTVIPPGRHLGYIFEWAFIALLAALVSFLIQLRPALGRGSDSSRSDAK